MTFLEDKLLKESKLIGSKDGKVDEQFKEADLTSQHLVSSHDEEYKSTTIRHNIINRSSSETCINIIIIAVFNITIQLVITIMLIIIFSSCYIIIFCQIDGKDIITI